MSFSVEGIPKELLSDPFYKTLLGLREFGWGQEKIARELGVSLRTVVRWCRGEGQPLLPAVRKMEILGVRQGILRVS